MNAYAGPARHTDIIVEWPKHLDANEDDLPAPAEAARSAAGAPSGDCVSDTGGDFFQIKHV